MASPMVSPMTPESSSPPEQREEIYKALGAAVGVLVSMALIVLIVAYFTYRYRKWRQRKTVQGRELTSCENPLYVIGQPAPALTKRQVERSLSNVTIQSELQKIVEYSKLISFWEGKREETASIYESVSILDVAVESNGDRDSSFCASIDEAKQPSWTFSEKVLGACNRMAQVVTRNGANRTQMPLCAASVSMISPMGMSFTSPIAAEN